MDVNPIIETGERIPDSVREAVFNNVIAVQELEQKYTAELGKGWRRFGYVGWSFAVLCLLLFAAKAARPPEVHYAVIDNYTGRILADVPADRAASYYDPKTVMGCLEDYVEIRTQFIWQTDAATFHKVAIQSSPDEQKRFLAERERVNLKDRYGENGYVVAKRFFPPQGFHFIDKGTDKTETWDVQYEKAEVLPRQPLPVVSRETARVVFQLHPELPMAWADREKNLCGMYTLSYTVIPE